MSVTLSSEQLDKIGNTCIYLTSRVGELGKTKLLKLLFLLEEKSIKERGKPFFGLDFKLWQFGPVVEPIFNELTGAEPYLLKDYIFKNQFDEFEAKMEFNDDEFSENDIALIDRIVDFARNKTAKDLVTITHSKDSLWRKGAIERNIYKELESGALPTTDYSINFFMLFDDVNDNYLLDRYNSYLENAAFAKNFKELKSV